DSGIGQGIAYELASHGAAVAVNYLSDPTVADQMVLAMRQGGAQAVSVQMDVAREADVLRAFREAHEGLGGCVDLLVNNAGIEKAFNLVDMPLDWWQRVIDVNLTGA